MDRAIPQLDAPASAFTHTLSATPRGARLARLLVVAELHSRDVPSELRERAELVVAELAANAVVHGSPPGRCFRIALVHDASAHRLRIEVTDARGDFAPRLAAAATSSDALSPGGRGLCLVAALADSWDTVRHPDGSKTVWATLSMSATDA
jgi:anti-sigma regulatory factor (Ser/Thr protein kinase)